MTNDELSQQKNLILQRIQELESSLPYLAEETKAIAPSISLGRLTRMEALSDKGVNEHILSQNKGVLMKLHRALDRLEKGIYGKCLLCGNQIPLGRLQLVPEAGLCVPCSDKKNR